MFFAKGYVHITNSKQRKHRTVFPSAYGGTRIAACGAHSRTSNTDTKLLIYGLFQKGRVLAQDGEPESPTSPPTHPRTGARHKSMTIETARRASLEFVCVFGQDGDRWYSQTAAWMMISGRNRYPR